MLTAKQLQAFFDNLPKGHPDRGCVVVTIVRTAHGIPAGTLLTFRREELQALCGVSRHTV